MEQLRSKSGHGPGSSGWFFNARHVLRLIGKISEEALLIVMVVDGKQGGDFLALLRLVAKPELILRKPEFCFKLFTASQAKDLVAEPKELLPSCLHPNSVITGPCRRFCPLCSIVPLRHTSGPPHPALFPLL